MLIAVALVQIIPELNLSYADAGTAISLLTWTWAIAILFGGPLSDMYGRKALVIPSCFLYSLTCGLTGFASSVATLFAYRALSGVGEGLYFPAATALMTEIWPPERRGHGVGIHHCAAAFGTFVAYFFGAQIVGAIGWRTSFYIMAIPGIIIALIIWRVTKEPPSIIARREAAKKEAAAQGVEKVTWISAWKTALTCKPHNVPFLAIIFITSLGALYTILGFLPLYLTNTHGYGLDIAGLLASLFALTGVAGYYFPALWSDKVGRKPMLFLLFGGAVITQAIFWLLPVGTNFYLLAIILLAAGFFTWGSFPLTAAVIASESVPGSIRATAIGFIPFVGEVFSPLAGTFTAGFLADAYGLSAVMLMPVPLSIVSLLLAFALKETSPPKAKPGVRWD
jgi:MFS family permease